MNFERGEEFISSCSIWNKPGSVSRSDPCPFLYHERKTGLSITPRSVKYRYTKMCTHIGTDPEECSNCLFSNLTPTRQPTSHFHSFGDSPAVCLSRHLVPLLAGVWRLGGGTFKVLEGSGGGGGGWISSMWPGFSLLLLFPGYHPAERAFASFWFF